MSPYILPSWIFFLLFTHLSLKTSSSRGKRTRNFLIPSTSPDNLLIPSTSLRIITHSARLLPVSNLSGKILMRHPGTWLQRHSDARVLVLVQGLVQGVVEIEGLRDRASPASLRCVLEQDTLIHAKYWRRQNWLRVPIIISSTNKNTIRAWNAISLSFFFLLTHKAPPRICGRRQYQILPLFQK